MRQELLTGKTPSGSLASGRLYRELLEGHSQANYLELVIVKESGLERLHCA